MAAGRRRCRPRTLGTLVQLMVIASLRFEDGCVADRDATRLEHGRVDAADGTAIVVHHGEVAIDEPPLVAACTARRRH